MPTRNGGAGRDRTDDLLNANQALFRLSYSPIHILNVFAAGLFLTTENKCQRTHLIVCSIKITLCDPRFPFSSKLEKFDRIYLQPGCYTGAVFLLRKEVIQPQVPLRLPCYDLVPITSTALGCCLLAVGSHTSGKTGFHDLTGGVYKPRERIHGVVADTPLLAIPTSWSRVADSNPNWARLCRFAPPRGIASHCTGHCSTCAALDVRAILT